MLSLFTFGCSKTEKNIIEIRETMFAAQISEIYLNAEDYLGRTIKLEGIFKIGGNNEEPIFYVLRYAPDDCCGGRGFAGFEVRWSENLPAPLQYTADDSWVEATGILREHRIGGNKYLYLELVSLISLDKRGAEYVNR